MEKVYLKVKDMEGKLLTKIDDSAYEKRIFTPKQEDYIYIVNRLQPLERTTLGYIQSDINVTLRSCYTNKILLSKFKDKHFISLTKPIRMNIPDLKGSYLLLMNVKQVLEDFFVMDNEVRNLLQKSNIKVKGLSRVEGTPTFFYEIILEDEVADKLRLQGSNKDTAKFVSIEDVRKYKDDLNHMDKFFTLENFKHIKKESGE